MKIVNVSLWSQRMFKYKSNCKTKWNTHNGTWRKWNDRKMLFPCYPRNYIMEIVPPEWINRWLKKFGAQQTNAYIKYRVRLMLQERLLSLWKKAFACGEGGGWKGGFEIGQQESMHMPEGSEIRWTAWIFIFAHQPFSTIPGQTRLCC